ncbi:hypothetical protein CTAYLR_004595 [Chrysophaeum taylorii]|uniref:Succinylglutamate desuccinylase/Aspartoacylase catalytic domain-containing protein n=1 Tax=Chrysophaeum taylorii TaxID=2483200 RepID=A0AAD7UG58_9STRA|nr:hypothetical protein CTAYLR_004595 [Chrysophaeum taylorii]
MGAAAQRCVIRKVCVVGGTHGNEYTGVFVVRKLEAMRSRLSLRFPSLEITTLVANEAAHRENRRFLEEDLNRQFSAEKLSGPPAMSLEARRARELIASVFGQKASPNFDLVVDLHTTTANMGATIIADQWDAFAVRAAAHLTTKGDRKILYNAIPSRENSPYLASIGKHALQIECGPTPQGVLRHDVVEATEAALFDLLEFLENGGEVPGEVEAFTTDGSHEKLEWPVDEFGFPTAVVSKSLQDRDFMPLAPGDPVFVSYDGSVVPAATTTLPPAAASASRAKSPSK